MRNHPTVIMKGFKHKPAYRLNCCLIFINAILYKRADAKIQVKTMLSILVVCANARFTADTIPLMKRLQ